MGYYNYVKDLPKDACIFDDLIIPVENRQALIPRVIFEEIGDYTQSLPTSPSPGRIYRKALNWPALYNKSGEDPNWWVYVTKRDPDDPKYVLHHPFKVVLS